MARQIPRISGVDKKLIPILEAIRENIEEIAGSGPNRALRYGDFARGTFLDSGDGLEFSPDVIVTPSVQPLIDLQLERLQAVQTDVSTLAAELLGSGNFGSVLAAKLSDVKSLKVNVNGHIAGYGVAVYGGAEGPTTSDFVVQADRFSVVLPNPPWLPTQAYTLGQFVSASPESGVGNIVFEVTTAGTTGASEPAWNATPSATTASGSVVFTARTIDERVPFVAGLIGGVPGVGINGNLVVDGTITAIHITAGTITTDKLAAGAVTADKLAASLLYAGSIVIDTNGLIRSGQTAYDTGTGWWLGNVSGTPRFSIGNSAGNKVTWNGSVLTVVGNVSGSLDAASLSGTIPLSAINIAALGWTFTGQFSATDADTVAWTSGTFTTSTGTNYSISSGNTGNMSVRTYIYLDIGASTTALQTTTTAANAVGPGKVLIGVAQNDTNAAFFQVFGGFGGVLVTANVVAANSIVANSIAAGAITADKFAASLVYAGSIVVDTAGSLRSGQTAYDTGTGYWLGNVSGTPKFSLGNSGGNKLTWDGSILSIAGALNFTNAAQTWTPTWTGFSSPPSGDLSYFDFGAFVIVWWDGGSPLMGTSNSTQLRITNVPTAIRPAGTRVGDAMTIDNGTLHSGGFAMFNNGTCAFTQNRNDANYILPIEDYATFGNKGLPAGGLFMYPK